eukprot:COSAG03_NODE_4604_length_1492_cov_29.669777_1_plen_182_part_00
MQMHDDANARRRHRPGTAERARRLSDRAPLWLLSAALPREEGRCPLRPHRWGIRYRGIRLPHRPSLSRRSQQSRSQRRSAGSQGSRGRAPCAERRFRWARASSRRATQVCVCGCGCVCVCVRARARASVALLALPSISSATTDQGRVALPGEWAHLRCLSAEELVPPICKYFVRLGRCARG